jgi:hypothetical protein
MRLLIRVLALTVIFTLSACASEEREPTNGDAPKREQTKLAPDSDECPLDWPGPWTACPEADWVLRVAERAGYRITGETGSALVAQGKGSGFYIWGFEAPNGKVRKWAKSERWTPLAPVEGVVVYGDERQWRWWVTDGFILWLHAGPYEDSRLPSLQEMAPLVEASMTLPRP